MSVVDSTFPEREFNTVRNVQIPTLVSLNEVFRDSLRKAQAGSVPLQMIIRCESLPRIKTHSSEMSLLFDSLLGMILNHPPNTSQLFLYVDCEEMNGDIIDMTLAEGFKRYTIKFFTNVTTNENWKVVNSQALINCRQILSRHSGTLVVNEISSAGCLFSVSLPGKIE